MLHHNKSAKQRQFRPRLNTSSSTPKLPLKQIIGGLLISVISFYAGVLSTFHYSNPPLEVSDQKVSQLEEQIRNLNSVIANQNNATKESEENDDAGSKEEESQIIKIPRFFERNPKGIARVSKDKFVKTFDYGTPMDQGGEVFLLYPSARSFPSESENAFQVEFEDGSGIPKLNVEDATKNCDTMSVVTTTGDSCIAIVKNYENHHLQKWMRPQPGKPLYSVGRGTTDKGRSPFNPPRDNDIKKHWEMLRRYLNSFDEVVAELKPIAQSVAIKNTIVVMTCNMGQSELLMNFICNARGRGLDTSNVLIFPTDIETKDLAEGLGLKTFYDHRNFDALPSKEARSYGDRTFVAMMFAKVVCVQLLNMLGYDLLFQDVDVVWYKNPLDYFQDESNPYHDFDMYFQDDGAHSVRYAPTSANSGFYYVRNNEKTRYFFISLLYAGDLILRAASHQQAMIQVMAEHSSLFGLKVKILDREMEEFPGGWHYHRRKEFVRKHLKRETNTIIYHMSWTANKDNKLKFYQQMGEWYLDEKCIHETKQSILSHNNTTEVSAPLIESCCLAEAKVTCHYRDKPSIIPCKDSDPIDKGGRSFW